MNVGSILNGDSPPEDSVSQDTATDRSDSASRPSLPDSQQRHSINNLLNDAPTNAYSSPTEEKEPGVKKPVPKKSQVKTEASVDSEKNTPAPKLTKPFKEIPRRESDNQSPKTKAADGASTKNELVGSELQKINNLKKKSQSNKPRRYAEPPIWAREWVPPSQQHRESEPQRAIPDTATANEAAFVPSKPVFDRANMHSADLECSITGVIPAQATVRTIAEWLYANFVEISLENRQYVELELKFGTLVSKDTGARLDIGVSTECIYTKANDVRFEMEVHEVGWSDMRAYLEELEKIYQEEARKNPTKPRRKFATTESDNTDSFYQLRERNEIPQKIRISKDNQLSPPRYVAIQKKRVSDIFIHNPSSMYDLRLSLSIEFPVNESNIEPIMKKNKPFMSRSKKRVSYSHAPTVTRFDFTEVLSPKTTKNKSGKTITENDRTFELELEMDTFQIFRGFDRIRDGSDSIRFEELVEIFLNNARCLNSRVTKLASK